MLRKIFSRIQTIRTRAWERNQLPKYYDRMHNEGQFKGHTWRAYVHELEAFVPEAATRTYLDFGCGPKGGLAERFGDRVISHDPYVPQFAASPWSRSFDVVFSSDVLEHMPMIEIQELMKRIVDSQAKYVLLAISTRKAGKHLPNGANAHLTVKSARWWTNFFRRMYGDTFQLELAKSDLLARNALIGLRRRDESVSQPEVSLRRSA